MHRTSKAGTYRIDRVFPGVGRLAVASGATTVAEFNKRNALLARLYDHGRLDLLRAIKAGTYTVTEVYAADREDPKLERLTGDRAILTRPLWKAVEAWLGYALWANGDKRADAPKPDPTQRRYGVSFKALRARAGLPDSVTIEALGTVDWEALKARWPRSEADWFHLRAAVSHFLAHQLGNGKPKKGVHHKWRIDVMENFPTAKVEGRVPDITPELFWRIVHETPEFVRAAYVTIAALGLRVGEYLRLRDTDLLPHTMQVRIPGTKTAGSADTVRVDERLWPWITAAVPSPLAYKWLRTYWVRAREAVGAGDVRLHDLRHCFGQWLSDEGVPEARIQTGMRHATPAMTRRYTKRRDHGENARAMADILTARTA